MELTGKVLGMPYDLRPPTIARIKERMWNPDDPRIFTPRVFGGGWTINLATLREKSTLGFYLVIALYVLAAIRIISKIKKRLSG